MKKLLVILLLFFSILCSENETKAKGFPEGFFGLKFGDKFDKKMINKKYYQDLFGVTGKTLEDNPNQIIIIPPKPNKRFQMYVIFLTPKTKIISGITAIKNKGKMTLEECKKNTREVSKILENKYTYLPKFIWHQPEMKEVHWAIVTMDIATNLPNPVRINLQCSLNPVDKTYGFMLVSFHKKLTKVIGPKEEADLIKESF